MKENKSRGEEDNRYTKISDAENILLGRDLLVYIVKGITWLIKTPIKWAISKILK